MKSTDMLRRELRASMGDRGKLSQLHAVVMDSINHAYGEERVELLKLKQEIKNALNCRVLDKWGIN